MSIRDYDSDYEDSEGRNPNLPDVDIHRQVRKRIQKKRNKRSYAKQARKAKRAGAAASNTARAGTTVMGKLQTLAAKNAPLLVTAGVIGVLFVMLMSMFSSCGASFQEGISTTLAASYLSEPEEIDAAELAFSEMEMELQKKIDRVEWDYPYYDEYNYSLDGICHDPFVLVSYLSAKYGEFTLEDVRAELEELFNESYKLTLTPETETRTGTRQVYNPDTGSWEEETYEYEVYLLNIKLEVTDLGTVVNRRMDGEQTEYFDIYQETHGLIQQFDSPLAFDWQEQVSSYYGYRKNPVTGEWELHRGVDIEVPEGTAVYAPMDGTVTAAGYDSYYGYYVVIENEGYCTKYAHLGYIEVCTGETVSRGTVIGTSGSTGSGSGNQLHIECMYDGEYYNPLFYFNSR